MGEICISIRENAIHSRLESTGYCHIDNLLQADLIEAALPLWRELQSTDRLRARLRLKKTRSGWPAVYSSLNLSRKKEKNRDKKASPIEQKQHLDNPEAYIPGKKERLCACFEGTRTSPVFGSETSRVIISNGAPALGTWTYLACMTVSPFGCIMSNVHALEMKWMQSASKLANQ